MIQYETDDKMKNNEKPICLSERVRDIWENRNLFPNVILYILSDNQNTVHGGFSEVFEIEN